MSHNYFVLPFSIGVLILVSILLYTYINWIVKMDKTDRQKIWEGFFTLKTLSAVKEVVLESLVHRKIYRKNPVLGYMHMSLAFGWFLLIVVGSIEVKFYNDGGFKAPYYPIFFRYLEPNPHDFPGHDIFPHLMDALLLIILSGVTLALIKRIRSGIFGMKRTTKLKLGDNIALYSLWAIFPLRFLAESVTSGIYNTGGFATNAAGLFLSGFLDLQSIELTFWWMYSSSLGIFFVSLPFSRYMHIPTEVVLILFRNYGVKTKKYLSSISEFEVYSCSRCGICIDACQLQDINVKEPAAVNFIRSVRNNGIEIKDLYNCFLCGRCTTACPVGLDINALRIAMREEFNIKNKFIYDFEKPLLPVKPRVIYFTGSMGHLTPSVIKAMKKIFEVSGENYWFMDEDKGVCCGRPLIMAGQHNAALQLINHNRAIIKESGATMLVTSCPICYKVFNEKYNISNVKMLHHSQYIEMLIKENRLDLKKLGQTAVYHDPCELGRGSGVYDEPRNVLKKLVTLQTPEQEREDSLCCGGCLGNVQLQASDRAKINDNVVAVLTKDNPEYIVTSCPACKKAFVKNNRIKIKDIAEVVSEAISN